MGAPKARKSKQDYLPNGQPAVSFSAGVPVRKRYRSKVEEEQDAEQEEQQE